MTFLPSVLVEMKMSPDQANGLIWPSTGDVSLHGLVQPQGWTRTTMWLIGGREVGS